MLYSVIFDRGHGSVLDGQFYIELQRDGIVRHSFLDREKRRIRIYGALPLPGEAWNKVEDVVSRLELKRKPKNILKRLFSRPVVDGPRYWKLVLATQKGKRIKKTEYLWQRSEQYDALERLLEQIAEGARQTVTSDTDT